MPRPFPMRLLPILALLTLGGCQTAGQVPSSPKRDATAALIRHPEFQAAARVAPRFVGEALSTITSLEAELGKLEAK